VPRPRRSSGPADPRAERRSARRDEPAERRPSRRAEEPAAQPRRPSRRVEDPLAERRPRRASEPAERRPRRAAEPAVERRATRRGAEPDSERRATRRVAEPGAERRATRRTDEPAAERRAPRRATAGADRRGPAGAERRPVRRTVDTGVPGGLRTRDDVIYGRNAVLEAARAGRVKRAFVAENVERDPRIDELRGLVSTQDVPAARVAALAQGAHQGVVAELEPRTFLTLRQLLDPKPRLLLALDGIEDPQNLGAILRSADGAGVEGVVLPERRSAPLTAAAVKASSGASEHLRLGRVAGLPSAISEVRRSGIWCVALDPRGELLPWEFDLTQAVCLVVGGEGHGVHRLVRERCDARVRLPMAGRIASLNASAAAAALLYEVARQRSA
jgi:23S rRNA (guanosine2251-2'-O)-methyltransferase